MATRKITWAAVAALLVAAWLQPGTADSAEIYKWRDASGVLHFTDTPPPETDYQEMRASTPAAASALPEPFEAGAAVRRPSVRGLFWKVSSDTAPASYILGTIHSEDERVLALAPPVVEAFEDAGGLVLEMVPDTAAMATAAAAMLYLDGRSLRDALGRTLFERSAAALAAYGIPGMVAERMKPWAVMATLSMPRPKTGQFLDVVLYRRAGELGLPVYGLETPREQVAVFDSIDEQDQALLLEQTLDQLPQIPGMLEEITRTYIAGDLDAVARLAEATMGTKPSQLARAFMRRLNDERNTRMVQRLEPFLAEGNIFIAVGALHLTGEKGLLRLLQAAGWNVSPVPL